MLDIASILAELALERPVFHSEADFQHAFAWQLHQTYSHAKVRLEYPVLLPGTVDTLHIDIWLQMPPGNVAIELKYITRGLSVNIGEEQFSLKHHAAQNLRSYDVVNDIMRLERLLESNVCTQGYACVLTNETYWLPPRSNGIAQRDPFRLHEGKVLSGSLGSLSGRAAPLHLTQSYRLSWDDYSTVATHNGHFRYLLVSL